jgi:hypothetical protein
VLRIPAFRLHRPTSLAEAAQIIAGEGDAARVVAGGTVLWPNLKRRHQKAAQVVSLARLPELRGVHANGDLRLGAMESLTDVEHHAVVRERFPALARAVGSISSPLLRVGRQRVCLDPAAPTTRTRWRSIPTMKADGKIHSSRPPRRAAGRSSRRLAPCSSRSTLACAGTATASANPVAAHYRDDGIEYLPSGGRDRGRVVCRGNRRLTLRTAFKLRRRGSIDFSVLTVAVALGRGRRVIGRPSWDRLVVPVSADGAPG